MGGKSTDEADRSGKIEIKYNPKCYAIFRPHDQWKGEYGFDWVRFSDEEIKTYYNYTLGNDYNTKDILGKYLSIGCSKNKNGNPCKFHIKKECHASHGICLDTNGWSTKFNPGDDKQYNSYRTVNFKYGKYFKNGNNSHSETHEAIPLLTILKGKPPVTLKLRVYRMKADKSNIINPSNLIWVYNRNAFKIVKREIDVATITEGSYEDFDITITCEEKYDQNIDELIEIKLVNDDSGSGMSCGKLRVLANDSKHRKAIKLVFVRIQTNIGNGKQNKTGAFNGEYETIQNILNQAYLELLEKTCIKLPIKNFNKSYIKNNGKVYFINEDGYELLNYLNSELNKYDNKYNSYFKIYSIGESRITGSAGFTVLGTKASILFQGHPKTTHAHELLHSLGLPHTFVAKEIKPNAEFTYKAKKTDNIMDYSHTASIERISTFYWQWKIMFENAK
jgi:hypothetical protein